MINRSERIAVWVSRLLVAALLSIGVACHQVSPIVPPPPSPPPPPTTLGVQTARPLNSTSAKLGYYEYLPGNYAQGANFPALIFFHGVGEKGNGTTDLASVLRNGPPMLIDKKLWPKERPFVVLSPQSSSGFPSPDEVRAFIDDAKTNYKLDPKRVYLTGLSAGGITIFSYIAAYQDQVAAVVPIAGSGDRNKACVFKSVPLWAFHGDADGTVNVYGSINPVQDANKCVPAPNPKAKVTIYKGIGHDSWSRTYDLSGLNSSVVDATYDPFDENIYDWLLKYSRP